MIVGLQVVIVRRKPEIVEHHQPVLVTQRIECLFRTLARPVADHVEMLIPLETEIGLQPLTRHTLHAVVHSPVTSFEKYANPIHPQYKERRKSLVLDLLDSGRRQRRQQHRNPRHMRIGDIPAANVIE